MATYNLIDEPWIPFLNYDGTLGCAGLKEILCRAHEICEIFDPSPLVNVSLHRLLLALLHRNFGPKNLDEWKTLWMNRRWDGRVLTGYFEKWYDRFDLFHLQKPFFQVDEMPDAQRHPVKKLAVETATGNNATLFDHNFDERPVPIQPAEAARLLVASQAFSVGGGVSRPFNFCHAPLVDGYTVMPQGSTLFETLMLNLTAYNEHQPIPQVGEDLPAWERDSLPQPDRRGNTPTGYVDYLTWQSRRIHLFPQPDGTVSEMQRMQGLRLPGPGQILDPFKCYQRTEEQGWDARNFDFNRALWRDAHALFQTNEPSRQRPRIFNWLARMEALRRVGELDTPKALRCSVIGLATNQAKVAFWRHETLPLPLIYLEEQELVGKLRDALALVENVGELLRGAVWSISKQYLLPLTGKTALGRGQKNDVNLLTERLAPGRVFWPRLKVPFKRLLGDLANDVEHNEQGVPVFGNHVLPGWAKTLNHAARDAFREVVAQLGQDASAQKAVAVVEPSFMGRLFTEIKPYLQEVTHA